MRAQPAPRGGQAPRRKGGFLKKLLPIAKLATRLIPIPGAGAVVRGGIDVASKLIKSRGMADDGLGALYAAPDGTVYQMQGVAEDEMHGFAAEDQINGFAADDPALGDEVAGSAELDGVAAPAEYPTILSAADGAVGAMDPNGMDGYVPERPARTRWYVEPTETPEIWKPLW